MSIPCLDILKRKFLHLRFQPIRVFCFHHVSDEFDETTMYPIDWLQTDVFKAAIDQLYQDGYTFISLTEAYEKLKHDTFRFRKYAVLTADDGWASLQNILPWLNERQIPVTLFLNPAYMDAKHFRKRKSEQYLTRDEVESLHVNYPLLTIGSHGWEHVEVTKLSDAEFSESVERTSEFLGSMPNYIPHFAFPYGIYNRSAVEIVRQNNLVPVFVNGGKNYLYQGYIDREVL